MFSSDAMDGRVSVVTGGLGQLGTEFTLALLEAGSKVVIINRSVPELTSLKDQLPIDHPNLLILQADVTDKDQLEAAAQTISETYDVPDVLINNAGIDSKAQAPVEENGPFETYPLEAWRRVLDVNVTGVMLCCQVFGAAMARAGKGSIINVGSIYGMGSPVQELYSYREERDGNPFFKTASYSASKSALVNFTKHLATYWAKAGVRVNLVSFGGVHHPDQDETFIKNFTARTPMGRQAQAQ